MSSSRQTVWVRGHPAIRSLAVRLERGAQLADHAFGWGQLVFARSGVGRVKTANAEWLLPAARALWVPPHVRHVLHCTTRLELSTLYLPPGDPTRLPDRSTVLQVSPLLREVIVRLVDALPEALTDPATADLLRVLRNELERAPHEPLGVPLPTDPIARRVADSLLEDPVSSEDLSERCRKAGASRRTVERRFLDTAGISLGAFHRSVRLHRALALLGLGKPVLRVAKDVGYASPSAFVAAFRKTFGVTPAKYFAT